MMIALPKAARMTMIAGRTMIMNWNCLDTVGRQFGGPLTTQLLTGECDRADAPYRVLPEEVGREKAVR